MGRPTGSLQNKQIAVLFANFFSVESRMCSIGRCGRDSVFGLFAEVFPSRVRGTSRHGVSQVEINKVLEARGFVRHRCRRTLRKSSVLDACSYRFNERRWRCPDNAQDYELLCQAWDKISSIVTPEVSREGFFARLREVVASDVHFPSARASKSRPPSKPFRLTGYAEALREGSSSPAVAAAHLFQKVEEEADSEDPDTSDWDEDDDTASAPSPPMPSLVPSFEAPSNTFDDIAEEALRKKIGWCFNYNDATMKEVKYENPGFEHVSAYHTVTPCIFGSPLESQNQHEPELSDDEILRILRCSSARV